MSPKVDIYMICTCINQSLTAQQQHQEHYLVQPEQEVHHVSDLEHLSMLSYEVPSEAIDSRIQFLLSLYALVFACYVSHMSVVSSSSWERMPHLSSILHLIMFILSYMSLAHLNHLWSQPLNLILISWYIIHYILQIW